MTNIYGGVFGAYRTENENYRGGVFGAYRTENGKYRHCFKVATLVASSLDAANETLLNFSHQEYPADHDWYGHYAATAQVTPEQLQEHENQTRTF